ncbi:hypothetical protein RRF57_010151 [Xylaria bambusicola]|uniref:Large ribosomal subunit protein uL10 n=1 Tax=Xylaria bambusicola TaxID=326684 RepID=A0AAN7US07_9PEZI
MGASKEKKAEYFPKLKALLEEYKSVFIVTVDNVSSQQMHEVRQSLRNEAVVLMGKNTMVRRALKTFIADTPEYEKILPHVKGNVGFVFTNGDLKTIRDKILSNKVAAPARAGAIAPADVWVPAGNTGMEPGKTSFFQALGVPTKIARGTIEITTDLKLVESGNKVGPSEATLLNMLNISPFTYGLGVAQVYDEGNSFSPDVLDISEDQLLKTFTSAITTIACVSLAINFPTLPSVIHSLVNGYKKVLAVAIETSYSWPEIEELKDRIANPDAYASAAPTAAAAETKTEAAAEVKDEEEAEESGDEGFGGLFMNMMFTGWHENGLRVGSRHLNVRKWTVPRSFAGQLRHFACDEHNLSTSNMNCECDMLLANHAPSHLFKRLVSILRFIHDTYHVFYDYINNQELFNPEHLLMTQFIQQHRMRHNIHVSALRDNSFAVGGKANLTLNYYRPYILSCTYCKNAGRLYVVHTLLSI